MSEYNRFSKGIFGWVGFKTYWLSYDNVERIAGESKWNFWKLFKYAVEGIINFSQAPLSIASWSGIGINSMCDYFYWRDSTFLPGNYGAVYSEDIYGNKTKAAFYYCGYEHDGYRKVKII